MDTADHHAAHLFLKAANEGVLVPAEARRALRKLYPNLFEPGELEAAAQALLDAMKKDVFKSSYSLNVEQARVVLAAQLT